MLILGIDPGSTRAGYGLVEFSGSRCLFVSAGILDISSSSPHQRLVELSRSFQKILKKYKPDAAGIERLYFSKNLKTAIEVSQSRGILLLHLQEKLIPFEEFTPLEIKQGICGYGNADKKSVETMVKKILNIHNLDALDDAFDALAIAIVAAHARRLTKNI